MDINVRLRESLNAKGNELVPSPELKAMVMSNFARKNKKIKNRLIKIALVACILVPTSAFSFQTFLSDNLYGSFDNLKKHIASATMDGYLLLNAKLTEAKGELKESQYREFKKDLSIIANAKLEYADKYGNINYDKLPPKKVKELEKVYMESQPFFDKLNGRIPSKDLLTPKDYRKYIEALMTYEEVLVKSGINPKNIGDKKEVIPPNLQDEYQKARDYMEYVDNLQ